MDAIEQINEFFFKKGMKVKRFVDDGRKETFLKSIWVLYDREKMTKTDISKIFGVRHSVTGNWISRSSKLSSFSTTEIETFILHPAIQERIKIATNIPFSQPAKAYVKKKEEKPVISTQVAPIASVSISFVLDSIISLLIDDYPKTNAKIIFARIEKAKIMKEKLQSKIVPGLCENQINCIVASVQKIQEYIDMGISILKREKEFLDSMEF